MFLSLSLITAASVQILCQVFKVIYYSLKKRQLDLSYFISAGGMPSAHSAFVTALTLSLGFRHGFASDYFSISSVFSLIIIYDAIRLRGAVQSHSRILLRLVQDFPDRIQWEKRKIPQMIGHSLPEVIAGIIAGGALSGIFYLIFKHLN